MLIPPWIIDDLEDEQRDSERPGLSLPLGDAHSPDAPRSEAEEDASEASRGVMIVDISPSSDHVIRL